jgi:hypothetical protein
MFQNHDDYKFKKIIDEFILSSSSDNESIKYILRKIDFGPSGSVTKVL